MSEQTEVWGGVERSGKIMKLIILALLLMGSLSVKAQNEKYSMKFVSSKSFSGGGYSYKKHIIQLRNGNNENSCDTLLIDNVKYFVLHNGYEGEYRGKRPYWDSEYLGVKDPKTGRWQSTTSSDYDIRVFFTIGFNQDNLKPFKVTFINHGSTVTYLK